MASSYADPDYLKAHQYADSSNLEARANLHRLYTAGRDRDWFAWVYARLGLQAGERVLVCGGGHGLMWQANLARIPSDAAIVFTDVSAGMVDEAQRNLTSDVDFTFRTVDVQNLPFEDDSFDRVTANHMLYHVPDIAKAVAEIRRVLKPGGRFLAATNGPMHLHELKQFRVHVAPDFDDDSFILPFHSDNGAAFIAPHFEQVAWQDFDSHLEVTDFEPLLAYIMSRKEVREHATARTIGTARKQFEQIAAEQGHFYVQKSTGVFIAA